MNVCSYPHIDFTRKCVYNTHMGIKHQEAQRARWAKVGAEERARLGALHSEAVKKYWAGVPADERSERGRKAANARYEKE